MSEASLWRFAAKEGRERDFEALYGPGGGWATFYRQSPAYQGTFLLHDPKSPPRGYVLIDVWNSRADCDAFCVANGERYGVLDKLGEELTESERHEGWFEDVSEVLARL